MSDEIKNFREAILKADEVIINLENILTKTEEKINNFNQIQSKEKEILESINTLQLGLENKENTLIVERKNFENSLLLTTTDYKKYTEKTVAEIKKAIDDYHNYSKIIFESVQDDIKKKNERLVDEFVTYFELKHEERFKIAQQVNDDLVQNLNNHILKTFKATEDLKSFYKIIELQEKENLKIQKQIESNNLLFTSILEQNKELQNTVNQNQKTTKKKILMTMGLLIGVLTVGIAMGYLISMLNNDFIQHLILKR